MDVEDYLLSRGKISKRFRLGVGVLSAIFRKFQEDKCLVEAGNLAYINILSLVPLFAVLVSLFSVYGISPKAKSAMLHTLLGHMLPGTAHEVVRYIDNFLANSKALGVSGMIGLFLLAYYLFDAIQGVFQTIWKVRKPRSIFQKILIFTNVVFWTPLLMGLSVYLKARLTFFYQSNAVLGYFLTTLVFFLPWLGFTILYMVVPAVHVRWKSAAIGGAVASILWYLLLYGFDLYVKYTQSMQALSRLYGSLVIVPIFLIWIYFCWSVTFIGAEVTFYSQYPRVTTDEEGDADFLTALGILRLAGLRFLEGEGALDETEVMARWPDAGRVLQGLEKAGYIVQSAKGPLILAKPPEKIRLEDLFRTFMPGEGTLGAFYHTLREGVEGKTLRNILGEEA
jgi:YihY family inner membrane protein